MTNYKNTLILIAVLATLVTFLILIRVIPH